MKIISRKVLIFLMVWFLCLGIIGFYLASALDHTERIEEQDINKGQESHNDSINKQNPYENIYGYQVIKELSSPIYMGRLPGTDGNKKAVNYIVDQYKEIGLISPAAVDYYLQPFTQQVVVPNNAASLATKNTKGQVTAKYQHLVDFIAPPIWSGININGIVNAPLVHVSDVRELVNSNKKLNGKVLLVHEGVLDQLNGSYFREEALLRRILALNLDIKAVILNNDIRRDGYFHVSKTLSLLSMGNGKFSENGPMFLYCSDYLYIRLREAANNNEVANIELDYSLIKTESTNVVGLIEGFNPHYNDYIIIGAHLDHAGDNKDGTYNAGALDNASGVAGLLEIAKALKAKEEAPKKTILFIAFNGEEEYLAGSNYYVQNPIYPLDNATMINLDMIGSVDSQYLEIAIVDNNSRELRDNLLQHAKYLGINSRANNIKSSDHVPFTVSGVPSVMLMHLEKIRRVHTCQDVFEKTMDMIKFQEAVDLVVHYLEKTAY